jgi:hypothetical protein
MTPLVALDVRASSRHLGCPSGQRTSPLKRSPGNGPLGIENRSEINDLMAGKLLGAFTGFCGKASVRGLFAP